MNNNMLVNRILDLVCGFLVVLACILAWEAMVQFNHNHITPAIYYIGTAQVWGVIALVFAIIRAGRR